MQVCLRMLWLRGRKSLFHSTPHTTTSSRRRTLNAERRIPLYLAWCFCCCCCCAEVVSLDTTRVSARFSARSRSFSVLYFCSSYTHKQWINNNNSRLIRILGFCSSSSINYCFIFFNQRNKSDRFSLHSWNAVYRKKCEVKQRLLMAVCQ